MQIDKLLTELERQQKYLERLPEDFTFPLFNAKQALQSQRRNGYRNTAAAAREIVDNAIEAGAKRIDITFEQGGNGKYERSESVTSVAFIDNGPGMLPNMARYALSWGGGTHFDDPSFIGKFGFGLPNSSINQTQRVEVYTKIASSAKIFVAVLDVNDVPQHGQQTVNEPVEAQLPQHVLRYLKNEGLSFEHGTVVVWSRPDRLSYKSSGRLKEHLIDDFGATYRYLLDGLELVVEGVRVEMVDPLFLDPKGRLYLPDNQGGAKLQIERSIPVKYILDSDSGMPRLLKVESSDEIRDDDEDVLAFGKILVRISRFPVGFVDFPKRGKKVESDAHRRGEIRKTRAGMSFVRAGREIETLTSFPRSQRDQSAGLGRWPLLQGYAYHLGIEIGFTPALDDVFGITNDKQSVRPIEDFWRVLAKDEIDRLVSEEYRWQPLERERIRKASLVVDSSPEATPAENAAASADAAQGKSPQIPEYEKEDLRKQFEAEAKRQLGVTAQTMAEAQEALEQEAKRRPYKIAFEDVPGGPFFVPEWTPAGQVLVRVNRKHPFYESLYLEAVQSSSKKVKHAIDVLLLTLGKAEVTSDNATTRAWYEEQREGVWSPFLKTSLKILAQSLMDEREAEGEEDMDGAVQPQ